MASAFYGGVPIFGPAPQIVVVDNPTAAQVSSFFGVEGVFLLHGGTRGRMFEASGILSAVDLPSLATLEALFRSYEDGIARVLTDTKGVSWGSVVLRKYSPVGKWHYLTGARGVGQPYKALFQGLL